ncbi:hypothetical protein [Nocardioides panacisoli]|uniref:Transglycosylase SLT domain-containing protein n=1 Tax=Nocardioides panacisoli TaxID=627624 RepID=A0ABP7IGN0_9ACTN
MPDQPRHSARPIGRALRRAPGSRRTVLTALLASGTLTAGVVTAAALSLTSAGPTDVSATPVDASAPTSSADAALESPATLDHGAHVDVRVSPVADVRADLAAIPLPAMSAYQRAADVIDRADRSCHLDWTVLAGVGQVVSQHGLVDGARMTHRGVVKPALVGKVVRNNAGQRLTDTDAGRLDGDKRHDRAVGPMLLAPSTWNVVGVDADGDGKRNPQDVDDAALGVSVLLCSGQLDLRKDKELARAVGRVNDDRAFVRAVLSAATDYARQAAATPVTTVPGPVVIPTDLPTHVANARGAAPSATPSDPVSPAAPGSTATSIPGGPHPTHPSSTDTPDPTDSPTDDPTECTMDDPSSTPSDLPTDQPTDEPTDDPCATDPTDEPSDSPSESPTP